MAADLVLSHVNGAQKANKVSPPFLLVCHWLVFGKFQMVLQQPAQASEVGVAFEQSQVDFLVHNAFYFLTQGNHFQVSGIGQTGVLGLPGQALIFLWSEVGFDERYFHGFLSLGGRWPPDFKR
jgi:hypothetical protein